MYPAVPALPDGFAFLAGGGAAAHTIAGVDWAQTSLGPVAQWPRSLKAVASLLVRSPAAMVLMWGPDGTMLYNEAYAVIAGDRHPASMGAKVCEAWPEIAEFNRHVLQVVLAGGTLTYKDQPLTVQRNGYPEQTWFTLDYSAVSDDNDQLAGVLAVVLETTGKVMDLSERQANVLALAESEARLHRAQEAGRVGVFTVDMVSNLISGTREFFRIFGFDERETMPTEEFEKLVLQEDTALRSAAGTRGTPAAPLDVEYRIHRASDGALRWIARKAEYEQDANGRPVRMLGVVQDVTERKLAQLALEQSAEQFRSFAQAQPNQVWTAPANGLLDWFNDRVYDYSGARPGDLDGQAWAQIVHPHDIEQAATLWAESLATGKLYEVEFRIRRADGAYRWHLARALPQHGGDGAISRWVGTNTDIHERKLLEVESTRDRNRIWTLSSELMLVCDYAGRIIAVNPAAERLLGWTEADMVGGTLLDFVHPDDVSSTAAEVAKLADGVTTLAFENRYRAKDGDYRLLNWAAVPDGGLIHGIARDVTRERQAEDALRQAQKMEALGQLTGGIAHDFNNILQGIMGSITAVQRLIAHNRAGEVDRFIAGAINSSKKAAALTHRLLAFSRRQPLEPRTVQVNPLVASMEEMLQRTLGERITLKLALSGGLWPTKCDPNQLENAILNLAINSRDAMPDGGTLMIETRNAVMDGVLTTAKDDVQPGRYVCVAVTDTGTGMDASTLAKAFDPFFTTKPLGQGTGLGLSMIYGFARQSEGYAKIYSEPGKGTTVKLYLPLQQDAARADEVEAESFGLPQPVGVGTVAVVEDETVVRELVVGLLSELGYLVLQAHDGPSGLKLLQNHPTVNLLVTDVGLPGMNGRQLADAARELNPGLRVLFMTGYAENAVFASGMLETGMSMITKPFAMDLMATRVREMLLA